MIPKAKTLQAVCDETARARALFAGNAHRLLALLEEVGELAEAMLEGLPLAWREAEAIQVAAMAVRIVEEGDHDFERAPAGGVREIALQAIRMGKNAQAMLQASLTEEATE